MSSTGTSTRTVLGVVAAAAGAVGLVVGFTGVTADGQECGSPFWHSDDVLRARGDLSEVIDGELTGDQLVADCAEARAGRQTVAIGAVAVAVVMSGGALLTAESRRDLSAPPSHRDSR